ncbi:MAG: class I adenylate-forming enzyme family protein [Pseudomonadota bacterium]
MPHDGPPLDRPYRVDALLSFGMANKPDEPVIVSRDVTLTWRALDEVSARLAANYLERGLRPGDRVASLMPNRAVLIVHYLACMKAGLVSNPLNYRYTPPEIDHVLEATGASMLVAHGERDGDIAACEKAGSLAQGVIRYVDNSGPGHDLGALMEKEPASTELPTVEPQNPCNIIFTSGSTGLPKGVTHSFETFGWALSSIAKGYEVTDRDVVLASMSLSHGGGVHVSFSTLAAGGLIVVPYTTDADELLPLMREHRPTMMGMLPATLFRLIRHEDAKPSDFESLRFMLSGGDKVPRELELEFKQLANFDIEEGYGATEVGLACYNRPGKANRLGSVGTVNPGFSFSLRDDNGNEVKTGEIGKLWIKSPTVMIGYWNAPEATHQTKKEGWFDTGDMMRVDEDGYFWFEGRRKQIIVHDGSNVSPQEVEAALLEHPAVGLAGVVGVRNLLHGENVRAYITLKPGAEPPDDSELIAFARQHVGYKAPEEIVVLDDMPLVGDGKVDRVLLKKWAAEEKDAHHG